MLKILLMLSLVSGYSAAASEPRTDRAIARAAAGTPFQEEFRAAYGSVLWTMMFLRWCNGIWKHPRETAAAEARFRAINAQAIRRGLKRQMEQAADDNARQMAVMRLDIRCSGGFDRPHTNARRALTQVEQLLGRPRRA